MHTRRIREIAFDIIHKPVQVPMVQGWVRGLEEYDSSEHHTGARVTLSQPSSHSSDQMEWTFRLMQLHIVLLGSSAIPLSSAALWSES